MTKYKWISAIAALLFAVAAIGWVTTLGAQGNPPHTVEVKITPNANPTGPPTVVPEAAEVGRQDQVEWSCTSGCNFTVVFTEPGRKPFKGRVFDNTHRKSGTPTGPPGKYEYSVIVGQGSTDPQIIVH